MSPGNPFTPCRLFWVLLLGVQTYIYARASIPAFSGAEGSGAITLGGRGGRVIEATRLADSGLNGFREALAAVGPRIVVFRLDDSITLQKPLVVTHPFLPIAGQTVPGDDVRVRGGTVTIDTNDVIIRYLRFRCGNLEENNDCLKIM
jgi:hypothetical protein